MNTRQTSRTPCPASRLVLLPLAALLVIGLLFPAPASAQVPGQLHYSIPAPFGSAQSARLGSSVAVDGDLMVVGAPDDDTGARASGTVKIFNTNTGALLALLVNPTPEEDDWFGTGVGISGQRVVVWAPFDRTSGDISGSAYVYDLSGVTPTVPVATLTIPESAAIDFHGPTVAISGTRVIVGALGSKTGAIDAGSAYIYDLTSATPAVPVFTINNPTPGNSDYFGYAVAISGTRVVIGAFQDDTGANDAGSAYVYDLAGANPTVPVVTLNDPNRSASDLFGWSVAIDGTRVAVGARNNGLAYVYDLTGASPSLPVATLHNLGTGTAFGSSVAIAGTRVAVGNPFDNTGATAAGSTYVYDLTSPTPTAPVATLHNPDPASGENFGNSVAISGSKVVVGTPGEASLVVGAGAAYVYDLAGATPTVPIATANTPSPSSYDRFGQAVAVSGTRVVAGAGGEKGTAAAAKAYVYDLASATPTLPALTLNNPYPAHDNEFGAAVAMAGNWVVVSAPRDEPNPPGDGTGSAYVYDLGSAMPTVPVLTLHSPSAVDGDYFGRALGISGTWLVAGAEGDNTGADYAGRAFVYDLAGANPAVPVFILQKPNPAANEAFGKSVAISGTRVAVGMPGESDGGGVYVYDLASATPTVPVATLHNSLPAQGTFGYSVAISGTRVVVPTFGNNSIATIYIYDLASATPTVPVLALPDPNPAVDDGFGSALAISGTRLVVGAETAEIGAIYAGSAYVYDLAGATPTVPVAVLPNPTPATFEDFGAAVAIDGTTVAIGTPGDGTVIPDKGAVYIYGPNPNDQDNNGLLDSWELARFGNATGHLATDDDDHAGFINLLKEAFNPNPLAHNTAAAIPAPVNEGGYLTITISKHPGVTYQVQSAATTDPAAYSAATTTILLDNASMLKVRDNFPIGTTPGRFMRVQVTAAP